MDKLLSVGLLAPRKVAWIILTVDKGKMMEGIKGQGHFSHLWDPLCSFRFPRLNVILFYHNLKINVNAPDHVYSLKASSLPELMSTDLFLYQPPSERTSGWVAHNCSASTFQSHYTFQSDAKVWKCIKKTLGIDSQTHTHTHRCPFQSASLDKFE